MESSVCGVLVFCAWSVGYVHSFVRVVCMARCVVCWYCVWCVVFGVVYVWCVVCDVSCV